MTEQDPRAELTSIRRQLRHWLEREQAGGAGELLASSVAAPVRDRAAESAPVTAPVTAPADAWEPVAIEEGAAPPAARPAARPAVVASAAAAGAGLRGAPPASAAAVMADTNLFGERVPRPAATGVEVVDDPIALPPVHPPLNPIGEARAEVLSASLPVLDEIAAAARACEKCGLCRTRTQAVPGVGSAASGIVFVGEAPGADEDAQGEPFVGRAGQLLTQMIQAMDDKCLIPGVRLDRSTVYICNVLKCRPPENRNPLPHEIEQCSPYLKRQLEVLQPRVICCLGKFAAELLVGAKSASLGAMRGKTYRYRGAKLIVTYHPAALLRNPSWKRPAWEDLQRLAAEYQTD